MKQPSQPQQAQAKPKPAPGGVSSHAQTLLDTMGKLETTPDVPVSINRLRQSLPNMSEAEFTQAWQELRAARKVYPTMSDEGGGLVALTLR